MSYFNNVDGYIKESDGDKYLIFASANKSKKVLTKHTKLWDEAEKQIETIIGDKPIKYEKGFMKINFESDDLWVKCEAFLL